MSKAPESLEARIRRWKSDFPAYCREALWIKTKDMRLVPFELNRAQLRFWKRVERELEAGRPVRMYILKARQLGFSTVIKALEYWVDTLNPYRNSLTISHSLDSATELFSKHQVFYGMSPAEARPETKRSNRKELRFAKEPTDDEIAASAERGERPDIGLQSSLMVQTADNQHLGASYTLHFIHLSEFARYERIRKEIKVSMATLMATCPNLPDTFVFIETTAFGLGYAKDFWDKEDNGFIKLFVSWVADDQYRYDEWAKELDGFEDLDDIEDGPYGNEAEALEHVRQELLSWYPEQCKDEEWLKRELKCRMAWRRRTIRIDHQGDLDLFRQEYPIYAEEAFLTTGDHVFDTRKLHDYREALYVEDEHTGRKDLVTPPTNYRYHQQRKRFYPAKYGPLRVYEEPKKNQRYVLGADVSEGVSHGDASAAVVLSLPELKQVAVFHAGWRDGYSQQSPVDPDDFADILNVLGRWYNTAYIACEVNGPGFATNLKLGKHHHYPLIYRREVFDAKMRVIQKKYGWHSNRASKNVLITDLRAAIRDDEILFTDVKTLEELGYYVQDGNKQGAASGKHDDLVIATALALQMAVTQNFRALRTRKSDPPRVKPEGNFDWWAQLTDRRNAYEAYS